jgi:dihydroneopterin aldolase
MSEFKREFMQLVLKYYPDYEHIEVKVSKPFATFPAKIEVRVME